MNSPEKRKLIINAASSVLQVVVTGLFYFLLYSFLVKRLGAEQLGVWSLVLATSSIANLANFGITSGLIKFAAEYKVTGRFERLPQLIGTSLFTIFCFFTVLVGILYFAAFFILKLVVEPDYLQLALQLLPFSLLSLFLNGLAGVFTSVLEGLQKNYLRNAIITAAIILLYFLTVDFTPRHGLVGVAYAQVIQAAFVLIMAAVLTFKSIGFENLRRMMWRRSVFNEIISYGMKFQVVSVAQMLYEPTTKALLSKFGGLQLVGFYEMASRLVSQLRALVINANQVIIPVVAEAALVSQDKVKHIYRQTLLLSIVLSVPIFILVILLSPIISEVWIGKFEFSFVVFVAVLALANLPNIFSGPAYFGFMGEGKLNPLIKIHVLIAVLNLITGLLFGYVFGGYGIATAWCVSLALPSIALMYLYNSDVQVSTAYVRREAAGMVVTALIFILALALYLYCRTGLSKEQGIGLVLILSVTYALISAVQILRFGIIRNSLPFIKK